MVQSFCSLKYFSLAYVILEIRKEDRSPTDV
jgi:hypothetical protein